jgi:hypothetical protein
MSDQSKTNNKGWTRVLTVIALLAVVISILPVGVTSVFAAVGAALAVPPPALPALPLSTQFDVTGFLQSATLDATCAADAHCGGTMVLNGLTIIVPKETIVILPASALTWQELFAKAPAPYTGVATGMALNDSPKPLTTYEFQAVGNRVGNTYIAGLVHVSQQDLNTGSGYINFMDYATGTLYVGGVLGTRTGARVQINDPASATSVGNSGRFGRAMTPDVRFQVDQDNPTIAAGTGFPMCFPRTDPAIADDAECPQGNRPLDVAGVPLMSFDMTDPALLPLGGALDPRKQAPMEVGDYINYSGTMISDGAGGTYISAHTIGSNVAIYTAPGTNPAYVSIEVGILGTGGLTVAGAGEAAVRTKFEGMTTDPSRNIHIYGVDVNPDGSTSDRDWGTIGVDQGPNGTPLGAVRGRWRFRPGCLAFGNVPTVTNCVYGPLGVFLPATREVRAVIEGQQTQVTALNANDQTKTAANGIFFGQYHAPIGEFIFPENIPGTPIVANNFNSMPFLASGGYASITGVVACQLNPWPYEVVPVPSGPCASAAPIAPVANAGANQTVASGAAVTLTGSASGNPTPTFLWAQTGGPAVGIINFDTATATFTAPFVAAPTTLTFTLTATNLAGSNTATTTVTINASGPPSVNHVAPITLASGANGAFDITGTDPNNLALTFTVAQVGAPALNNLVVTSTGRTSAHVTFQAPVLPLGTATNDVVSLTITAKNSALVSSLPEFTTVTVTPAADTIAITASEYRTTKQRLSITATSNVATAVLKLKPYITTSGALYDPTALGNTFTFAGGLWNLVLVGAPQPGAGNVLQVYSNLGGLSPLSALQKVRQ